MLRDMFVAAKWNLSQSRVVRLELKICKKKPTKSGRVSFANRFDYHF